MLTLDLIIALLNILTSLRNQVQGRRGKFYVILQFLQVYIVKFNDLNRTLAMDLLAFNLLHIFEKS